MEHLLVQLVTWLFETLFGSQEKPADVGPRGNSDDERSPKRGPYNYGDQSRPSTQGKSLAELLEEVRQQNAGGGGARPIQAEAPPPERRTPQQAQVVIQPEEVQQKQPRMKDSITSIHMRGLAPAQVQPPPPPVPVEPHKKKKKKRHQDPQEHPLHLAHQPTRMTMPRAQAVSFKTRSNGLITGANPAAIMWMDSIKSGDREQRKLAQTQALMAMEVFGSPRCRKPHRPGV